MGVHAVTLHKVRWSEKKGENLCGGRQGESVWARLSDKWSEMTASVIFVAPGRVTRVCDEV